VMFVPRTDCQIQPGGQGSQGSQRSYEDSRWRCPRNVGSLALELDEVPDSSRWDRQDLCVRSLVGALHHQLVAARVGSCGHTKKKKKKKKKKRKEKKRKRGGPGSQAGPSGGRKEDMEDLFLFGSVVASLTHRPRIPLEIGTGGQSSVSSLTDSTTFSFSIAGDELSVCLHACLPACLPACRDAITPISPEAKHGQDSGAGTY
jgi:hypothetical protein